MLDATYLILELFPRPGAPSPNQSLHGFLSHCWHCAIEQLAIDYEETRNTKSRWAVQEGDLGSGDDGELAILIKKIAAVILIEAAILQYRDPLAERLLELDHAR